MDQKQSVTDDSYTVGDSDSSYVVESRAIAGGWYLDRLLKYVSQDAAFFYPVTDQISPRPGISLSIATSSV